MKAKLLLVALVLLTAGTVAEAQMKDYSLRRTLWVGIEGNLGAVDLGFKELDGILGVTTDFAISINSTLAIGPYLTLGMCYEDISLFFGGLLKVTMPSNSAFLFGYGYGEAAYDPYHQFKFGFKFPGSFFLSGSYLLGLNEFGVSHGALFGLGFSFGGRIKG